MKSVVETKKAIPVLRFLMCQQCMRLKQLLRLSL